MEKIIDKVKKLIALGTNAGAADGERDNAIRMAHRLLAKHNLTMTDLEESVEERKELFSEWRNVPWTGAIANSIAKLFFCHCYAENKAPNYKGSGSKRKIYFIGKESNAITAMLMADYVIKSIQKEQSSLGAGRSFCNGASTKIFQRVMGMITTENLVESDCTGLAVISLYKSEEQANKEFLASSGTTLVPSNSKKIKQNSKEYKDGLEFGGKINLNGQISGTKTNSGLLN